MTLNFHRLRKIAAAALGIFSLVLLLVAPINQAHAVPPQAGQNDYFSDIFSGRVRAIDQFDSAQLEAIEDCLPEQVSASNDDIGDRIARAFGESGNDFLERAFNLKDNPTLSDAEQEFRQCLQSKGIEFVSPVE